MREDTWGGGTQGGRGNGGIGGSGTETETAPACDFPAKSEGLVGGGGAGSAHCAPPVGGRGRREGLEFFP